MNAKNIKDCPEYKEAAGKKYKKVKQADGSWGWVEVMVDAVGSVFEAVGDTVMDIDIDF